MSGMRNIDRKPGEELHTAVQQLGGEIESVEEITRLRAPHSTRCLFKLQLRDGQTVKGRRFRSAKHRRSVSRLMPLLQDLPFSRLIATHGATTLEQWINGTPLEPELMDEDRTRRTASIMGALHTLKDIPVDSQAAARDTHWYLARMKNQIGWLVEQNGMTRKTGDRLIEQAENNQPRRLETGLIHTDLHPRNMVVSEDGEIWIVDNEDLRLGALDYDLARCWRQWPMSRSQRRVFSSSYNSFRSLAPFLTHQDFWSICTLAVSARVHGRHGWPIHQFVENLERISEYSGESLWPGLNLAASD